MLSPASHSPGRGPTARRGVRRTGLTVMTTAAVVVTMLPAAAWADSTYWIPANERLQVHGHGYGHGRGMSQYGAEGAARQGVSWRKILDFYYPGTRRGHAGGRMKVLITADTTSGLKISPAKHLWLRDLGDGHTWRLRKPNRSTDRWELFPNKNNQIVLRYHDKRGWHRWHVPGRGHLKGEGQFQAYEPLTLWVPTSAGEVPRRYREQLRTAKPRAGSHSRDTVNVLTLAKYLQGVVPREMPALWNMDALRAQAVAARTYAVRQRAAHPHRYFNVDDTTRYQLYGGYGAEHPRTNQAVRDTRGTIVTYGGSPALTEFSSSSGGWTAGGSVPYQRIKRDRYDGWSGNHNHSWSTSARAGALEHRYPGIGNLQRIVVTDRNGAGQWGGRIQRAVLHGSRGNQAVSGADLRWVLGLKSTWFTIEATPIIRHWRHIGGRGSVVGAPVRAEYPVGGGAAQRFQHGRIYYHSGPGAHESHGPILAKYRHHGGASAHGVLGFPKHDVHGSAGGNSHASKQGFQRGRIYSLTGPGTHEIHGPTLDRYDRLRGAAGRLGFPTSDVHRVRGGLRSNFQHGWIRWDRSSGKTTVHFR